MQDAQRLPDRRKLNGLVKRAFGGVFRGRFWTNADYDVVNEGGFFALPSETVNRTDKPCVVGAYEIRPSEFHLVFHRSLLSFQRYGRLSEDGSHMFVKPEYLPEAKEYTRQYKHAFGKDVSLTIVQGLDDPHLSVTEDRGVMYARHI